MQIESDIERKQDVEYARADRNQVIVSQADDDGDEGADHDRRVGEWMFEPEARCDCRAYNQGDSGEGVDEYGGQRDQGAGALEKIRMLLSSRAAGGSANLSIRGTPCLAQTCLGLGAWALVVVGRDRAVRMIGLALL